LKTLQSAKPST